MKCSCGAEPSTNPRSPTTTGLENGMVASSRWLVDGADRAEKPVSRGRPMAPRDERLRHITRRHFLKESQAGLGALALASLLSRDTKAADDPLAPRPPHFPPKAKRVIYLHLTGSPPHLDLFDYKPELVKHNDQPCPDSFLKGKRFAFTSGVPKLLGTPRKF